MGVMSTVADITKVAFNVQSMLTSGIRLIENDMARTKGIIKLIRMCKMKQNEQN